jgi:hypothetical protein
LLSEHKLMRLLIIFLAAAMAWMATVIPGVGGSPSALMKSREGSLVLGAGEKETAVPAKKDALHTMLSREVEVYVFRGGTRIFPQPSVWGQTQGCQPNGRWQKMAGPYLEGLIQKYALRYGVDPSLVRAVMRHESGFNPNAVSPKGAQGLMQLMPGTASLMGVTNPFDPEQNIAGGVGYLRHCLDRFGHSVPLAVAAYNAGPARVAKSKGVPAIPETQAFVKNVLGSYGGASKAPVPPAQPLPQTKAHMETRPAQTGKILPTARKPAPPAEADKAPGRPRPKVIIVRYPSAKRVAAAKPRGAD